MWSKNKISENANFSFKKKEKVRHTDKDCYFGLAVRDIFR